MTTTDNGRQAEQVAGRYLMRQGFRVLEYNYRTRSCEIDIIAQKQHRLYFVEVKYRASATQGNGLEYVTPAKQRQMQYSAETWLAEHNWCSEISLGAIEVSGPDFIVGAFVDVII